MSTQGDCSPIVTKVSGDVSINCNFVDQIPVERFETYLEDGRTAKQALNELWNFINKNDGKVFELSIFLSGELQIPPGAGTSLQHIWSLDEVNAQIIHVQHCEYEGTFCEGSLYIIDGKHGGVWWSHGTQNIKGYFIARQSAGTYQGITEIPIEEVDKAELLVSGKYKLQ